MNRQQMIETVAEILAHDDSEHMGEGGSPEWLQDEYRDLATTIVDAILPQVTADGGAKA